MSGATYLIDHVQKGNRETEHESVNRAFLDYFGCPAQFAPFRLSEKPLSSRGFFRFGSAICYGDTSHGHGASTPERARFDALTAVEVRSFDDVRLSFSPSQAVDNLRCEQYLETTDTERLLRSLYYFIRPLLPFSIRKSIQRLVVSRRFHSSFPHWPVDTSVEVLFENLMEVALRADPGRKIPFIWFWPDGHQSAQMMTHDVEDELGVAHCDILMDLDDAVGLKAAFQLVPEVRYEKVEKLIDRIRSRGFEANLHDLDHDGRLYEDLAKFRNRAERINDYAKKYGMKGFRAGAMHRNQHWFPLLNFEYEMSVPNVSHLEPQRGGCCSVMPYFVGKLLELPLTTIQDHGLFFVVGDASIDLWKQQIDLICARHGLISFIVHPDYIVQEKERRLYGELLQHLVLLRTERNIWWALPGDINEWWRQRANLRLVREHGEWRIQGRGRARARVAFACIENGKLQYQLADEQAKSYQQLGKERQSIGCDNHSSL